MSNVAEFGTLINSKGNHELITNGRASKVKVELFCKYTGVFIAIITRWTTIENAGISLTTPNIFYSPTRNDVVMDYPPPYNPYILKPARLSNNRQSRRFRPLSDIERTQLIPLSDLIQVVTNKNRI